MNLLLRLVSDGSGDPSTMRIAVLLIIAAVLGNWIYLTVHTGQSQALDWEQVGLILGSLAAKTVQSKIETNTPSPTLKP